MLFRAVLYLLMTLHCSALIAADAERPARILCIGDSITQADWETLSWRYDLWKRCVEAGVAVDFIGTQTEHFRGVPEFPVVNGQKFDQDHESQWGILASRMADELPRRLSHVRSPFDYALIHLGTNDAFSGRSADDILTSLQSMVTTLRKFDPNVTILIAQIAEPSLPRSLTQLNAALPAAVTEMADTAIGSLRG